jgi:mono/diheme cytochrome c family protein
MTRKTWIGLAILVLALSLAAQEKPQDEQKPPAEGAPAAVDTPTVHTFKISPEEATRKNPIRYTDVSVERGRKLYMTQCAMCHGDRGDGKGEAVEDMGISPPDFTKPKALEKRTDGELFAILGQGSEVMPAQGERMRERQKWNLVNFLRSFAGATPAKATEREAADEHVRFIYDKE